jgi:hypothetical protein
VRGGKIDILTYGLPDELAAFRVEAAVIEAFGLHRVVN